MHLREQPSVHCDDRETGAVEWGRQSRRVRDALDRRRLADGQATATQQQNEVQALVPRIPELDVWVMPGERARRDPDTAGDSRRALSAPAPPDDTAVGGPSNGDVRQGRGHGTRATLGGRCPEPDRRGHRKPSPRRGSLQRSGDGGGGGVAARGWHEARPGEDSRAEHGVGHRDDRGARVNLDPGLRAAASVPAAGLPTLATAGAGEPADRGGPA